MAKRAEKRAEMQKQFEEDKAFGKASGWKYASSRQKEKREQELKEKGIKKLYLFTDTYSNYEYYEHRGYDRKGTMPVDFGIKGSEIDPISEYYIYIKEL